MVGQHHHGVDMERVALFYDAKGIAQASDMVHQQTPRTLGQVHREKIGSSADVTSPVSHGRGFLLRFASSPLPFVRCRFKRLPSV